MADACRSPTLSGPLGWILSRSAAVQDGPTALDKDRLPAVGDDHLLRPRLLRRLDRTAGSGITLVCAPPGFGKTSLVARWARGTDETVVWLRLSEEDGAVPTFARQFVAAIRAGALEACKKTSRLLRRRRPVEHSEFAEGLLADLQAEPSSFVLVLDDYCAVPSSPVHGVVEEILGHLPASKRMILIARYDPPFAFHDLLVSGRASEIRQADLAFDCQETAAFLAQKTGWTPTAEQVERLAERLDGWPTGIRLLAQSLTDGTDRERVLENLPRGVQQAQYYLCTQLFERLPSSRRSALLQCSILGEFTSELCAAVLDPEGEAPDSPRFDGDERDFFEPIEGRRGWYRIRPLVQDFVVGRRGEHLDEEVAAELHDRAAAWLNRRGHVAEAIDHALQGSDPKSAAVILADHRKRMIDEGRHAELFGCLQKLPEAVIDSHADTMLLRVWATPTELMREAIARVEGVLARNAIPAERAEALQGELKLVKAGNILTLTMEDPSGLPKLVEAAREALDLLPRAHRGARATAYHLLAQGLQFSGDLEAADVVLEQGVTEFALGQSYPLSLVLYTRCLILYAQADLVPARDAALGALACELAVPPGSEPTGQGSRVLLGGIHYQWNELDLAAQELDHVESRSSLDGAQTLAMVWQAQGKTSEASALMREVLERSGRIANAPLEILSARAGEAALALAQGRPEFALRWAVGARTEDVRPLYRAMGCTLVRVRILIEAGMAEHRKKAASLLQVLEDAATRMHQRYRRIQILGLKSLLHASEGNDDEAFAALETSLHLAVRSRYIRLYLDLGPAIRRLLAGLPVPGGLEEYVSAIRGAFVAEQVRASSRLTHVLSEPLTDRELDVLGLIAERLSNKEIARRLHVSLPTVKSHALKIYQKLHVNDRWSAVEKAVGLGLLPES